MSCWCCWNLRTRVHPPWSPSVTVTSSPSWNMLSEEILKFGISRQVCRSHIAIDDNDKWKDDDQIGQPEGPCCSQLLRNKNKVRCSVLRLRWRNPPPTWDIQSQRKNRQHPHISVKGSLSDTYTFTLLHYKKAPLLFGCPIPKWKLTPSPSPPSTSPPWTVAASSALLVAAAAIADRPVPLASLPAASLPSDDMMTIILIMSRKIMMMMTTLLLMMECIRQSINRLLLVMQWKTIMVSVKYQHLIDKLSSGHESRRRQW